MNHQVLRTTLGLATAILSLATGAQAGVFFSDDFNSGASALWGNQSGSWTASGGVYRANNGYPVNCNALPFNLTDYQINLDINNVADGGIWLRTDGTGQNGILLVTGGDGWFWGSRVGQAGKALYFHEVVNGTYSPYLSEVMNVFNPTVDNPHIRVDVIGNTFSVFLNGSSTPITTLTDSTFASGFVGLSDSSDQTFDNVTLQTVPEPSGLALAAMGVLGLLTLKRARKRLC